MRHLIKTYFGRIPSKDIPDRQLPKEPTQRELRRIKHHASVESNALIVMWHCSARMAKTYPSEDILNFKNLLKKNQIKVNKFICSKYLESILEKDLPEELQISRAGIKTIMGMNQNEVQIVPKTIKKHPFFERLFKFFLR